MDSAALNINKLVSLTFDERPEVRKDAARRLGEINDPAAAFALVELTFDKDPAVREVAHQYLDKRKQKEPEIMSFATIFATEDSKEQKPEETPSEVKDKVLRPITQIFERKYGKEKAEVVKSKMMPSIEKMYQKAHSQQSGKKREESGRKVMQEFITSYLEVISDLDRIEGEPLAGQIHALPGDVQVLEPKPHTAPSDVIPGKDTLSGELEVVGKGAGEVPDDLSSEISTMESQEVEELKEREEIEHLPDTFFKKAYEIMMLSNGDEDVMKQEMNRMIEDARREIGLAFRLAKKRFKETKITNITKIKDGMRNVNTDMLVVKTVESVEYQKTKTKKAMMTRMTVNDEGGNEGVIYLFDSRGQSVAAGMRIKVVMGIGKTFDFSGETALALGKKGNVYIVL